MARKKKEEEHENHERWLVSYADFITLLFAFFVVMYSISSVNEGKYRVLSESLIASFRSPTKSVMPIQVGQVAKSPYSEQISMRKSPVAVDLPDLPPPRIDDNATGEKEGQNERDGKEPQAEAVEASVEGASSAQVLTKISGEIEEAMAEMIEQDLVDVRRSEHWVEVEINSNILFPSGQARIAREALPVLRELAGILRPFPNAIHVEGFTDNVPINNVIFPSNWELSAGRAASVVHLFTKEGVQPERMVAIGYGQYRPVADNTTAEGRRKNRRVVIVVQSTDDTRQVVAALDKSGEGAGPAAGPADGQAAEPAASPATRTRRAQRPTHPGLLRQPGRFPVIKPPIQLPFGPRGQQVFDRGRGSPPGEGGGG